MRSSLRPFDHAFGVRRSCSEERSLGGGCGVLGLIVGWPCSPLSRLISLRRRWISAWAARSSALTSSSRLSSRLTSSRACSSAMLCRSRSSSIVPLAPAERHYVYCVPVCPFSPLVATCYSMGFQPRIFEVIRPAPIFHTDNQGRLALPADAPQRDPVGLLSRGRVRGQSQAHCATLFRIVPDSYDQVVDQKMD